MGKGNSELVVDSYSLAILRYPDGGTIMREHPAGYVRSPTFAPNVSKASTFAAAGISTAREPASVELSTYTGLSRAPVDIQISSA